MAASDNPYFSAELLANTYPLTIPATASPDTKKAISTSARVIPDLVCRVRRPNVCGAIFICPTSLHELAPAPVFAAGNGRSSSWSEDVTNIHANNQAMACSSKGSAALRELRMIFL